MPEESIRLLLASRDLDGAATAALEAYGPGILGFLCAVLPEDDARDAFSFFAEDLWRGLDGFRGESTVKTWAYRLASHAAAKVRRDGYRRRRVPLPPSAASRIADRIASQSGTAPGGRRDRLARLRESLSPEERCLLVLRVDREMEWEEIALVLGAEGEEVSSAALRKRYERLKDKLAHRARLQGLLE